MLPYKNWVDFTGYPSNHCSGCRLNGNFNKNTVGTPLNNIWTRRLWLTTHSSPCDGCNHKKCSWREKMRRSLGSCSFHTPPSYMRCPTITVCLDQTVRNLRIFSPHPFDSCKSACLHTSKKFLRGWRSPYTPTCIHRQILNTPSKVILMIINEELWQKPGSTQVPFLIWEGRMRYRLNEQFGLLFSFGKFNSFLTDLGRNQVHGACCSTQTAHKPA